MDLPDKSWAEALKAHGPTPRQALAAILDACVEGWYLMDIPEADAKRAEAILEQYTDWIIAREAERNHVHD